MPAGPCGACVGSDARIGGHGRCGVHPTRPRSTQRPLANTPALRSQHACQTLALAILMVLAGAMTTATAGDTVLSADVDGLCAVAPSGALHCTGTGFAAFADTYQGPFSQVCAW